MFSATRYRSTVLSSRSWLQNALIVVVGSILLAVVSQISIPWQPIPLTFQSAMVILLGLALGSKRATAVVFLYLLEGSAGLPVFAGGYAGISVFTLASAGYLIGFLPAAFLAGYLMEKGFAKNILTTFVAALMSVTLLFACGVFHLQTLLGWDKAVAFGVKPFLITEPLKLLFISVMAKFCWKAEKR